jgi:hypothetical protein
MCQTTEVYGLTDISLDGFLTWAGIGCVRPALLPGNTIIKTSKVTKSVGNVSAVHAPEFLKLQKETAE